MLKIWQTMAMQVIQILREKMQIKGQENMEYKPQLGKP